MKGEERTYRSLVRGEGLCGFRVVVQETDLMIHARHRLDTLARELTLKYRGQIEGYIEDHPDFARTLQPWPISDFAPAIVREMILAGEEAGVGPMAAVAGALAEYVGRGLLQESDTVIVENGGDIFIRKDGPVTAAIYAGASKLSLRIGIRAESWGAPFGICTSSGTVGHSLSWGRADGLCILSHSCILADAVATAAGNLVNSPEDIETAIAFGREIPGVTGLVAVVGDRVGAWGKIELVPL